jgi:anti-anti-sigma factor
VKLVVDMSRVEYVSSSGWGVFASRIKDIRAREGDFKIFGMDEEVHSIFHMLGFETIMRSFGVLSEAIENFKIPSPAGEGYEDAIEMETAGEPVRPIPEGLTGAKPAEPGIAIGVAKAKDGPKGIIVLSIAGAVDSSTSDELESRLEQCLAENPAHLVLDLSDMVYIGSSGWGIVVKYMQKLGASGGALVLAGMNSTILKIFRDLGFEPLIPHFGTLERALGELRLPKKLGEVVRKKKIAPAEAESRSKKDAPVSDAPVEQADAGQDLASALLGKADIIPLEPLKTVKEEEKVIFIDFKQRTDVREDKDHRIKKLGWEGYGKKLSESEKNQKHRKK